MKRFFAIVLVLLACACAAGELLRVSGGVEERASVPEGLPEPIAAAYEAKLREAGFRPVVVATNAPAGCWCTRVVRTLDLDETNGVWRVGYVEAPEPIRLDRSALVGALLALPDGTNKLAAAMAVPAVAEWFVGAPVYTRGSALALGMQALLGVDRDGLEAIVRPCAAEDFPEVVAE